MVEKFVKSGPENLFALRQLDKFMEGHKGFVAGGCFKNLFSGERIKDIDVFFESSTDWFDACTELDLSEDFEEAYTSENVNGYRHKQSGTVVELVRSVFGTPEEILSKFDFTVVKFAYFKETVTEVDPFGLETTSTVYRAIYHPQFFEHLHLKRCIIDEDIPKPMSTLNRVIRYAKYGYTPCTETKQKLIEALRKLPEEETRVPRNFYDGFD